MKQNLYKLIESAIINLELIANNFKSTNAVKMQIIASCIHLVKKKW